MRFVLFGRPTYAMSQRCKLFSSELQYLNTVNKLLNSMFLVNFIIFQLCFVILKKNQFSSIFWRTDQKILGGQIRQREVSFHSGPTHMAPPLSCYHTTMNRKQPLNHNCYSVCQVQNKHQIVTGSRHANVHALTCILVSNFGTEYVMSM